MTQQSFESENRERWGATDSILTALEKGRHPPDTSRLPAMFRQLCADASLAQHRMYGLRLTAELNERVIRCRNIISRKHESAGAAFTRLVLAGFPRAVRKHARLFWLAMALFWVPMISFTWAAYDDPRWIFSVLGPEEMSQLDEMYGFGNPDTLVRGKFDSDFAMFGFYIWNNVSIGLKVAGAGVVAMIGSMYEITRQGVMLGAMEGYVHYAGDTARFYYFTAGHTAFELIGIVICGMAGMMVGKAILQPRLLTRREALGRAGTEALPLVYGGVLLIIAAAFIEAFWSASAALPQLKLTIGFLNALLLAAYLLYSGRDRRGS